MDYPQRYYKRHIEKGKGGKNADNKKSSYKNKHCDWVIEYDFCQPGLKA